MTIRPARDEDSPRIFEIRSEIIRTSDAILEDEPWSKDRWEQWWKDRDRALPLLVLVDSEEYVQGYAIIGPFSDRSGYRITGEISIHLDLLARGKGHGKRLLLALVEAGRSFGFHSLISRITSTNIGSISLHEKLGFTRVGYLPKVARKFGNFVDVTFYLKNLIEG